MLDDAQSKERWIERPKTDAIRISTSQHAVITLAKDCAFMFFKIFEKGIIG
jgi:hypothetical protein